MDKEFKKMLWQNSKFLVGTVTATALGSGFLLGLYWFLIPFIGVWPGYAVSAAVFFVVVVVVMTYLEWRYKQKAAKREAEEKARRDFLYQQDQEILKTGLQTSRESSTEGMEQILKDIRRVIDKKD